MVSFHFVTYVRGPFNLFNKTFNYCGKPTCQRTVENLDSSIPLWRVTASVRTKVFTTRWHGFRQASVDPVHPLGPLSLHLETRDQAKQQPL
jgi:hypothetical protein